MYKVKNDWVDKNLETAAIYRNFKASNGWFFKLKKRHELSCRRTTSGPYRINCKW